MGYRVGLLFFPTAAIGIAAATPSVRFTHPLVRGTLQPAPLIALWPSTEGDGLKM